MSIGNASDTDLASLVEELRATVAELKDRQEVVDVLLRYSRGIDRLDEKSYFSAFWPDARIGYGTLEAISPQQHWDEHMQGSHKSSLVAWGHFFTNQSVDLDGDTAHIETYVWCTPSPKNAESGGVAWGGRYIDRVERRDGEWRIAAREFVPFFSMRTQPTFADMWPGWYKDAQGGHGSEPWSWWDGHDTRYVRPLPARTDVLAGPPRA